jgi:hypothetical protein
MASGLDYGYVAVIAGMLALLLVLIFMVDSKITRVERKLNIIITSLIKNPNNTNNTTSREKNPKKAKKK